MPLRAVGPSWLTDQETANAALGELVQHGQQQQRLVGRLVPRVGTPVGAISGGVEVGEVVEVVAKQLDT
jgi:hypothetical protein